MIILEKSIENNLHKRIYDIIKSNEKLKINKNDGNFMKRMMLDSYMRQTRGNRINELFEQTKPKLDEGQLVKTFNRLIEDANRRMEAFDNMDMMKQFLDEKVSFKKYTQDEWDSVYKGRFMERYLSTQKHIDEIRKEKFVSEIEKEQEILNNYKTKKVAKETINKSVERLYNEAERRKLAKEAKIKEVERHREDSQEMPSQYKSRQIPKYNFGVNSS